MKSDLNAHFWFGSRIRTSVPYLNMNMLQSCLFPSKFLMNLWLGPFKTYISKSSCFSNMLGYTWLFAVHYLQSLPRSQFSLLGFNISLSSIQAIVSSSSSWVDNFVVYLIHPLFFYLPSLFSLSVQLSSQKTDTDLMTYQTSHKLP